MDIPIIFENEDFLVLNKPAGLPVHPDGHYVGPTITDWIKENKPECIGVGESMTLDSGEVIDRPGIVHRLDKDTSGVLLVAKNNNSHQSLKELFQNHDINKKYVALVEGSFKKEEGVINVPIGRSKKDPRKRIASPKASGVLREAETHYKVIKNFKDYAYVELWPKTGRTHQIRVHLKYINHPVVCDHLYGNEDSCVAGLSRQALHAETVSFSSPKGEHFSFEAPLPADIQKALEYLDNL